MAEADGQLLAQLIDGHGAALKLYARQWCATPDDVVQQALIDLVACTPTPDNPVAWLFAAVRRRAISRARAERTRLAHEAAAAERWFARVSSQHEAALIAAEALAELSLMEREIVVAHVYGRLTFAEVGQLVGMSTSAAHRSYDRALARMRERMGGSCLNPNT